MVDTSTKAAKVPIPSESRAFGISNSNPLLSSWLHHSDTMQFLTTFCWMTFMAPPLPVRVQAITLKCWTNTTDPTTWIKHTNIVSFVLFLNNSGYWMLFVFNENESNNYQLNEIWPTKLCIKNVIETGPLSPMSNLVGDCAEWEIKEIRDQGSHPLSHLPSCPTGSNINNFLINLHL